MNESDEVKGLKQKALALASLGKHDDALSVVKLAINIDPHNATLYNNAGQLLALMGRDEDALENFSRSASLDQQLIPPLKGAIRAALRMNRVDIAIARLEQSQLTSADLRKAMEISILQHLGLFRLAVTRIAEIPRHRYDQDLYLDSAVSHWNIGELDTALEITLEGIQVFPNAYELKCNAASLMHKLGRDEEALGLILEQVKLTPDIPLVLRTAAIISYSRGLVQEAIEFCERAYSINPQSQDIKQLLFNIYAFCSDLKQASRYQNRVRSLLTISAPCSQYTPSDLPTWNVKDMIATVCVYSEEGIGDDILGYSILTKLLSFFPSVTFILYLPPKLATFLRAAELPQFRIYPHGCTEINDHILTHGISMRALTIELLSNNSVVHVLKNQTLEQHLESYFVKSLREIFFSPYINSRPTNDSQVYELGICWRSANPYHGPDKSILIDEIVSELSKSSVRSVVSLQYLPTEYERSIINSCDRSISFEIPKTEFYDNIDQLAQVAASCEKVLTVGNVTAHIAGLLGIETFLLLPSGFAKAYYWSCKKNGKSYIYPSVNIFEKKSTADPWSPCINRALSAIS